MLHTDDLLGGGGKEGSALENSLCQKGFQSNNAD